MSKIIVAMIVKNEEAMIERAIRSVSGADVCHILDTGSQDRTIEIAERLGAIIHKDFIWTDSFCDAQNHLLNKLRDIYDEPSWIVSLDADEQLITPIPVLRELIEKAHDIVRTTMVAEGPNPNTFYFGRIFRNCPEIFWQAAIHKHLNVPGEGEDVGEVKIMYGHSPAHELDPDRSLRMLEHTVSIEKNPVRNLYYLAREYYYKERWQDAVDTFQRYIKVAHWRAELAEAYFVMAQCYEKLKMVEEMGAATLQAIKTNSNFKEAIDYMCLISIEENQAQWRRMARTASNEGVLWVRTKAEKPNDVIFLSVHNDDESLFGAFTLLRHKPLVIVITESFIQPGRGDIGCDAETRRQETIEAMKIAGCPVVFLGIKDTELTEELLRERLKGFNPDKVYVPALQGGNSQHDIANMVGFQLFAERCVQYTTYTKTELYTTGTTEIKPTQKEIDLKNKMLSCYKSQLELSSTYPHFKAVEGRSEWLL